jgi:peptidoglycan/xylan/chitin deacetylase (PgdA/CDA1 family)
MVNGLKVDLLAVSVDGRWAELGANSGLALTRLKDNGGFWSHAIGIDSVPFTMVVDSAGNIRWTQRGVGRSDEMAAQIRSALESRTAGTIYLTFDDFPKPYSFELLDLLRAQHVPATFFCVCDRAAENAALLKKAVEEGNALEIHAWNHDEKNPPVAQCAAALLEASGEEPTLYRAPGTETVRRLNGQALGGRVVDPYDYKRPGKRELMRRVLSLLCPGCIIQLHAGVIETMDALPDIIAAARKQGYEFALLKSAKPQKPGTYIGAHNSQKLTVGLLIFSEIALDRWLAGLPLESSVWV